METEWKYQLKFSVKGVKVSNLLFKNWTEKERAKVSRLKLVLQFGRMSIGAYIAQFEGEIRWKHPLILKSRIKHKHPRVKASILAEIPGGFISNTMEKELSKERILLSKKRISSHCWSGNIQTKGFEVKFGYLVEERCLISLKRTRPGNLGHQSFRCYHNSGSASAVPSRRISTDAFDKMTDKNASQVTRWINRFDHLFEVINMIRESGISVRDSADKFNEGFYFQSTVFFRRNEMKFCEKNKLLVKKGKKKGEEEEEEEEEEVMEEDEGENEEQEEVGEKEQHEQEKVMETGENLKSEYLVPGSGNPEEEKGNNDTNKKM